MPTAKITSKGQVTIPKAIRDVLGVQAGDRVLFHQEPCGRVVVEAETVDVKSLRGMLKHVGASVSVAQMNDAIVRAASQ
jgi:antitoxin PrlF